MAITYSEFKTKYYKPKVSGRENVITYFDEFEYRLKKQCEYIFMNNPGETFGKITAAFFSYYYGDGQKLSEYLKKLVFPEEDKEMIQKICIDCEKTKTSYIVPFMNIVHNISDYFMLYLTGNEYKFYILYEYQLMKHYGFPKDIYSKNLKFKFYANDYDSEILSNIRSYSEVYFDETDIGVRLRDLSKEYFPLSVKLNNLRDKQLMDYFNQELQDKIYEIQEQIHELNRKYFPELKYYDKNRIF